MASMEQLNNLDSSNVRQWNVDKKVPIALIFVVLFQTLGLTWGAATLSNEVKNNGQAIARLELLIEKQNTKIELELDTKRDIIIDQREMDKITDRVDKLENRLLDVERSTFKKK